MRSGQFSESRGLDAARAGAKRAAPTRTSSPPAKRRFVAVVQQLLGAVQSGALAPGDRLSPDRVLATEFQISRATVREALLALELLGVVEIRHGSGVYVIDSSAKSGLADKDWFTPSTNALFEARTAVEPKIARLCALRMTTAQIRQLSAAVTRAHKVVRAKSDYSTFTEVQLEFHTLFVKDCQNPILADINQHLMSVEEHPLWALLNQQAMRSHTRRMEQVVEHANILKHIKNREPEAAAAAMLSHLTDLGCSLIGENWVP